MGCVIECIEWLWINYRHALTYLIPQNEFIAAAIMMNSVQKERAARNRRIALLKKQSMSVSSSSAASLGSTTASLGSGSTTASRGGSTTTASFWSGSTWSTPGSSTPRPRYGAQNPYQQNSRNPYQQNSRDPTKPLPRTIMGGSQKMHPADDGRTIFNGVAVPYCTNEADADKPYPTPRKFTALTAHNSNLWDKGAYAHGFNPGDSLSPKKKSPSKSPFMKKVKSNISKEGGGGYRGVSALGARFEAQAGQDENVPPHQEDVRYDKDVSYEDEADEAPPLCKSYSDDSDSEEEDARRMGMPVASKKSKLKSKKNQALALSAHLWEELLKTHQDQALVEELKKSEYSKTMTKIADEISSSDDSLNDESVDLEDKKEEAVKSESKEKTEEKPSWNQANPPHYIHTRGVPTLSQVQRRDKMYLQLHCSPQGWMPSLFKGEQLWGCCPW